MGCTLLKKIGMKNLLELRYAFKFLQALDSVRGVLLIDDREELNGLSIPKQSKSGELSTSSGKHICKRQTSEHTWF